MPIEVFHKFEEIPDLSIAKHPSLLMVNTKHIPFTQKLRCYKVTKDVKILLPLSFVIDPRYIFQALTTSIKIPDSYSVTSHFQAGFNLIISCSPRLQIMCIVHDKH